LVVGWLLMGNMLMEAEATREDRNKVQQIKPTLSLLNELAGDIETPETLESFANFAETYQKTYGSHGQILHRLDVFKERVLDAKRQDDRARQIGSTARYGITKFSDLTEEEFRSKYLMKMPEIPREKLLDSKYHLVPNDSRSRVGEGGPPSSFDWRSRSGVVTPVYDQGSCGSCWAFSATENHESMYALQHGTPVQEMSVQQILDCDDPSQHGCQGGWPYLAWDYIYYQGGQDHLSCYPYVDRVESSCRYNAGCNAGSLETWTWIYQNDEPGILTWMWGNGPVSICLDASQWASYRSGVVTGAECAREMDHCVLITGYNMNNNPPYWNVRNTFGTNWGEDGYILLQYDTNTCGLAQYSASCHTT